MIDPVFKSEKKSLGPGQSSVVPLEACSRDQRLSGHLRKANNIVPFCLTRIRVIDPFTQMKQEFNTILDDADLLRIVFTLSLLRTLHDALWETFFKVTNNEMQTAKRYRNQLWLRTDFNNNCHLC